MIHRMARALGIVACSLLACEEPADEPARPGAILTDQSTQDIIASADIQSINGTYTGCTNRTGSWSFAVTGAPTLANPGLSVIKGDTSCSLAITSIRTGTDGVLTGSAPIVLSSTLGTARSFGTPIRFYANAVLGSVSFAGDFTLTLIFSEDPRLASGANMASFATVTGSSASAVGVPAPNYTLDLSGVTVTTDIAGVTAAVLGNVALGAGSAPGDSYLIVTGGVGASYAAINTAYLAGTPVAISSTITASAFLAPGVDLTGGALRTLIIAKVSNGVASYQKFAITFNPPV